MCSIELAAMTPEDLTKSAVFSVFACQRGSCARRELAVFVWIAYRAAGMSG
jgi:hypothetical protein